MTLNCQPIAKPEYLEMVDRSRHLVESQFRGDALRQFSGQRLASSRLN
jgi:hypothetical protein